jgi:hypothetical protein
VFVAGQVSNQFAISHLLSLAFTWAFVVGLWQASIKELKLKKHGYPPKSIFRRGLNILCRLVTNCECFDLALWRKAIKLLYCSYGGEVNKLTKLLSRNDLTPTIFCSRQTPGTQ